MCGRKIHLLKSLKPSCSQEYPQLSIASSILEMSENPLELKLEKEKLAYLFS